jgi:hypothetical protein
MLSMPWYYLEALSSQDLETASPLATAISSLLTITIAAIAGAARKREVSSNISSLSSAAWIEP